MKKMFLLLVLIACVLTSAFSQVQIFTMKNKTTREANLINPEFEIWPNSTESSDYSLDGKSVTYFFYEPNKSASDFAGDVWYLDFGDGGNVATWGYTDVYFYDIAPEVITDTKKANIACVVEFKNGAAVKPNLFVSLELAIYYKWDYYGYVFDETDDWSYIDEYYDFASFFDNYESATDYFSLNRYVTFWDSNINAAYFGYYPQEEAYDNIIYVRPGGTGGYDHGTSWFHAYKNIQDALDEAAERSSPTQYIQVWIDSALTKETYYLINAKGPVDIISGFLGGETHEFDRDYRFRHHFSGEMGDPDDDTDNLRSSLHIDNGQTNMPVYIDGFYFSKHSPADVDSALVISHTNAVVKNCNFGFNHHIHADGSAGPGGAGIWFSDKYNPYWGNSLHVESTLFRANKGVVRGASVTIRSCQKRAVFNGCVIERGEGYQFTNVGGIWAYAFQFEFNGGFFLDNTEVDYELIQAPGATNNYSSYNTPYHIVNPAQ